MNPTEKGGETATLLNLNLSDPQQLDLKGQRGVGWNLGRAANRAIREIGRKRYPAFAAHLHCLESLVPSFNKARAKVEIYRWTLVVGVLKFAAICEPTDVMDLHSLTHARRRAITHFQIHVLHSGFGGDLVTRLTAVYYNVDDGCRSHRHDQNHH